MGSSDGLVDTKKKIVDHGDDRFRWTLVILGDGFLAEDMEFYHTKVDEVVNGLRAIEPFTTLWGLINVHRIDVHSTERGVDDPEACGNEAIGGTGAHPRTYFDATRCGDGTRRRVLTVDNDLVLDTVNDEVADWEAIVVLVNSTLEGGTKVGQVAAVSLTADLVETVAHELGHFLGLADEYDYDGPDRYAGGEEPPQPNVTIETDQSKLKWRRHLAPAIGSLPKLKADQTCTTSNKGTPSTYPPGTVGLFEGALYSHCGVYRSEHDCAMRTVTPPAPFCAVCRDAMTKEILKLSHTQCPLTLLLCGAIYHSDLVWLRSWRDRHLAEGRTVMRAIDFVYRRVGPWLTRRLTGRPSLVRVLRRAMVGPLVRMLRGRGA